MRRSVTSACTKPTRTRVGPVAACQPKPKVADLLIDTEAEMKKVTWPTMDEVINSSIIVVLFVLFIGGYVASADALLSRVVRLIIFGGA